MTEFDILIIGGGPSGMTAAIYAQRANLKSCIIEKSAPGGKMVNTAFIENYPGFANIAGPDLAMNMYQQATKLGCQFIFNKAVKIELDNKYKVVTLENNQIIRAKSLIIATGMQNKKLNIPGEEKFSGRGVSYCAICDGMFFKNKNIAVVGSGNSACEESIYLSKIGTKVYLVVRGDVLKADAHVVEEIKKIKNIEVLFNTESVEIKGDKNVNEFVVRDKIANKEVSLQVDAVFPFIGSIPEVIDDSNLKLKKSANNYYIVDSDCQTSTAGIYAAGDVNDKKFRQISTAISDGTNAALAAKDYINREF